MDEAKRNPPNRVPVDSGGNSSASIHPTSSSTAGDLFDPVRNWPTVHGSQRSRLTASLWTSLNDPKLPATTDNRASTFMLPWERLAFVDLETSGLSPGADRIMEIGVVTVDNAGGTEWATLLNPEKRMPSTAVTA